MAIIAVWLTALAPTVSRALPSPFLFPDLGAWCEASPADHHGMALHDEDAGAACGYCTLFAQSPLLGGSFFIGHVLPQPGYVPATLPVARSAAPVARLHAPPRGPPVVAHA